MFLKSNVLMAVVSGRSVPISLLNVILGAFEI